jgi:hypothetical protein
MSDDAGTILKHQAALASQRTNWDSWWQDIALRVLPSEAQFTTIDTEGTKHTERLFDSTAATACNRHSAVMEDLLTPRTQKWHGLKPPRRSTTTCSRIRPCAPTSSRCATCSSRCATHRAPTSQARSTRAINPSAPSATPACSSTRRWATARATSRSTCRRCSGPRISSAASTRSIESSRSKLARRAALGQQAAREDPQRRRAESLSDLRVHPLRATEPRPQGRTPR